MGWLPCGAGATHGQGADDDGAELRGMGARARAKNGCRKHPKTLAKTHGRPVGRRTGGRGAGPGVRVLCHPGMPLAGGPIPHHHPHHM